MADETDILFSISTSTVVSEADYKLAQIKMEAIEAFSRITSQGIFVADLFRNRFMYVSNSPLVLFGHTAEEVKEGGYSFLIGQAAPNDRPLMAELGAACRQNTSASIGRKHFHLYCILQFPFPRERAFGVGESQGDTICSYYRRGGVAYIVLGFSLGTQRHRPYRSHGQLAIRLFGLYVRKPLLEEKKESISIDRG